MIYTLLSCTKQLSSDIMYYTIHGYDESDLTNLIPTSKVEVLDEETLKSLYKSNPSFCTNFSVDKSNTIIKPENLPTTISAESQVHVPKLHLDDVWNFLYKLKMLNAVMIITHNERQLDGFTDSEKTYTVNSSGMKYSTTHANCSINYLIDGTIYNPDTEDIMSSKRWTSYKIVKDNEVKQRYLTFITTKDGLLSLQRDSIVDIKEFEVGKLFNLPNLPIETGEEDIVYCIADLYSLPLVDSNVVLTSNFFYLYTMTQNHNDTAMYVKTFKAFMKELAERDFNVTTLLESDEAYKEQALYDDKEKTNGVKFSLSGQSSLPSVNACIKALKNDKVKTVGQLIDLTNEEAEEIETYLYRLNMMQKIAIQTLLHLRKELLEYKNTVMCYQSASEFCKFYLMQRELFKARLTYTRSMFMKNLHPNIFTQKKLFSNEINGTTIFIEFGEF